LSALLASTSRRFGSPTEIRILRGSSSSVLLRLRLAITMLKGDELAQEVFERSMPDLVKVLQPHGPELLAAVRAPLMRLIRATTKFINFSLTFMPRAASGAAGRLRKDRLG